MFVVFDTETTGLSRQDRIVEIALAAVDPDTLDVVSTYSTLINPEMPIPALASSIHGITDDMVASAPTFRDVASTIAAFMSGHTLVAHSISFDVRMVDAEFDRITGTSRIGHLPRVDTLRLSRSILPLTKHTLACVCDAVGVTLTSAHRAAGDVAATVEVLRWFLTNHRQRVLAA